MIENHYCKNCKEGTVCQSEYDEYGKKWKCTKCGCKNDEKHNNLSNQHTAKYICKKSFTHDWELVDSVGVCKVRCRRCKEEKEI